MKKDFDVSIIIINYNGVKYFDVLFDSLYNLIHEDFTYEVILVDNASSDNSISFLEEKTKDLKNFNLNIIKSDKNLGFAGGNNLGVLQAKGEYIVFLNSDTKVEQDWLTNLYHYICNKKDIVMANSKLVFFYDFIKLKFYTTDKILINKKININDKEYIIDNKFCKNLLYEKEQLVCFGHSEICIPLLDGISEYNINFDVIKFDDTDKLIFENKEVAIENKKVDISFNKNEIESLKFTLVQNAGSGINNVYDGYDIGFCELDGKDYDKEYEINNGCGASIIMKKKDFVECGMFDEKFFMYYEDTDLSYRIKKNGGKIMFCPSSIVRHIHTGSSTEWSPFFIYQITRNKLLFLFKDVSKCVFFQYFLRQILQGIREKNKYKIRGTLDAVKIILGCKDIHF